MQDYKIVPRASLAKSISDAVMACWSASQEEFDLSEVERATLATTMVAQSVRDMRNALPYVVWMAYAETDIPDFDVWLSEALDEVVSRSEIMDLKIIPYLFRTLHVVAEFNDGATGDIMDVLCRVGWAKLREIKPAWIKICETVPSDAVELLDELLFKAEHLTKDDLREWLRQMGYRGEHKTRNPAGPVIKNLLPGGWTAVTIIVQESDIPRVERALNPLADCLLIGDGISELQRIADGLREDANRAVD